MKIYYSASSNGFYPESMKTDYENSVNGWPEDATEITNSDYEKLMQGRYIGKVITADSNGKPVLTDPVIDWQANAESQRQSLLGEATSTTADWRTELQLDIISDDDKASLVKWMAYTKALKALDLTGVTNEVGYKAIAWPDKPE